MEERRSQVRPSEIFFHPWLEEADETLVSEIQEQAWDATAGTY